MRKEVTAGELNTESFTREKVEDIRNAVGDGTAINALSGGVDSSVVTMLGHLALGPRLRTVIIENGLMREGEVEQVVAYFRDLGVAVEVVDARTEFFAALKGVTDPEKKREAITQTFYRDVFGRIVRESSARYLLQGTILTDVDETVAGIKRQHNVFEQLGIDPQAAFGYRILEPLIELRKDGVRKLGKSLGLPNELFDRIPFPGPALAARVIGEATPERIETVRRATVVIERLLKGTGAIESDPDRVVDRYFKQCSVEVDVRDLAVIAATLAAAGRAPKGGRSGTAQGAVEPGRRGIDGRADFAAVGRLDGDLHDASPVPRWFRRTPGLGEWRGGDALAVFMSRPASCLNSATAFRPGHVVLCRGCIVSSGRLTG